METMVQTSKSTRWKILDILKKEDGTIDSPGKVSAAIAAGYLFKWCV